VTKLTQTRKSFLTAFIVNFKKFYVDSMIIYICITLFSSMTNSQYLTLNIFLVCTRFNYELTC